MLSKNELEIQRDPHSSAKTGQYEEIWVLKDLRPHPSAASF